MTVKEKLIEYIRSTYQPLAIVLHGSRANGNALEHSDYDFLIFTDRDVDPYRDVQFGANFEIKQVILPVTRENIKNKVSFFFRKENVEIVFDPDNIVPALLDLNESVLKEGNRWEEKDRIARFAFLMSSLDGITDYANDPLKVFAKKAEFYERAIPAWFRFLHSEFKPSDYLALPRIANEDPLFFEMINSFVTSDAGNSVLIGKRIVRHLFPDLYQEKIEKFNKGEV
jgi:predicted nucleotidyltransferase